MNFDAILKIAAKVVGTEQVAKLGSTFKQVEGATQSLTSKLGPLSGALGTLAPIATIGGLAAMAGRTIELGDALNDMSQRTGVSVESLARFRKAAATSGIELDTVAKNLVKLSKGLYETAQTGKGPASEALRTLGISATDAAGKLKTADQVTLEIANKFKTMPDGIEKTALAMQLFGKSGADMIPMLNEGGKAIESLSVKMTAAFAKKADEYNDKLAMLGGKVGGLAAGITVALLPALDATATALTALVDGFTALPTPIQAVVGGLALVAVGLTVLAPIITSVVTVLGAFAGLGIGATLAGIAGAIVPVATGLAALVAGFVSAPVLIGAAAVAAAVVIFSFRDQIADAFRGLFDLIANPTTGFIAMIGGGWNLMMDGISSYVGNILPNITENWTAFIDTIIGPENGLIARLGQTWNSAMDSMRDYAVGLVQPVTDAWESIVGTVRGVINGALSLAGRAVNAFIDQINRLIQAANSVSAAVRGPQLGMIQPVEVPQFAVGGRVDRPTLIVAGEAGPEYIVPQRKVPQFIQAQMGDQGLGIRQGGTVASGGTFAPVITLQTGPVIQQPDGSQWIKIEDAQAVAADAVGEFWEQLQTYPYRQALGMA
ncbi:MAG: phage tail tape measure protein [Cyanobium sp. 49614_E6]|nr:phage tail tape measure protein [Cyanobium sp. 49614_E6]